MEKFKLAIMLLTVLTVISAIPFQNMTAKAQVGDVGVFPKDYFKYGTFDGSAWATMTPSDAPPPTGWQNLMNMSTITFTVLNVTSPGVYYNRTDSYRNGTTTSSPPGSVINVLVGNGMGAIFFTPAGLSAGDAIYPHNSNFTWTLNSTFIDHSYWNGRTLNVLNFTLINPVQNRSSPFGVRQSVTWWDKETGVLVSAYEAVAGANLQTGVGLEGRLLYQLIDTNKFHVTYSTPADLTPVYAVTAAGVIVALAVVIIRYSRGTSAREYKRQKERRKSRT